MNTTLPSRRFRLTDIVAAMVLLPVAAMAQTTFHISSPAVSALPSLRLFEIARQIDLDASERTALRILNAAPGLLVEATQPLPNGISSVVVAVPEDDDCLPRAASLVCSAIRVVFVNDPIHGPRVSRVEAFERLPGSNSVTEIFHSLALGLGPALQTESWAEQIRGMPRNVWRRRWRPDTREGVFLEVMATSETADDEAYGLANPSGPAMGIGFVLVDRDIEESIMMARSRSRTFCHAGDQYC